MRDVRLTGVMKIEKKIIYLFMEGTVEGRICGSMNLWKYEFIEASPGMVEGSFQLGLYFCGIGGLKGNITKRGQGMAEGMVLGM